MSSLKTGILAVALCALVFACSKKKGPEPIVANRPNLAAIAFTQALCDRDYAKAWQLTTPEFRRKTSVDDLKSEFEKIVPLDWKMTGPLLVTAAMDEWPDKKPNDLGWAYVAISGDGASEGVTVVVSDHEGQALIRQVEWGRP